LAASIAAKTLGRPSAGSHQIKALEDRLGVSLSSPLADWQESNR